MSVATALRDDTSSASLAAAFVNTFWAFPRGWRTANESTGLMEAHDRQDVCPVAPGQVQMAASDLDHMHHDRMMSTKDFQLTRPASLCSTKLLVESAPSYVVKEGHPHRYEHPTRAQSSSLGSTQRLDLSKGKSRSIGPRIAQEHESGSGGSNRSS
ncbi:uncharacterized protein B0I36DRAFT_436720 [Microdochium trichocladiopsis]|uniref:Uncharacterized protein n=1 Tax=Microdochium trichocladiopsis TaxID=1682393 RepID=A0A9P9BIY1_9PEZI|nr:uncharacterized protein B0I36DRAFT_437043 [Microdochium trichocladiopsis]XP_046005038.1 uncharacterized protein B0I36DRAFT_436720 [Microdochium trichocladiopsis]KAH7009209.1 hypothetical protein B0I36DRAFT_437043 [Microdochium trichocladiopsis]KAH7012773.1 hypothetical protein B0I36DRAFT_436720 [Microdochium trichocladiopsis]